MSLAHTQLPFAEQINYYRQKLDLPTESYADIYGAEHDHAFVVAGANRLDMVADFRKAVDKAIADGTTLEEFSKDFDDIVAKYGWQYHGGHDWRSRIIYDTNLHSSYQAGRYEQQREASRYRPYWEYKHREGQRHPRPEHEAWDGLVLHCDDPWWQTHYPVNAYGCKCTVIAHNARSLAKRGLKVGTAPPLEYEDRVIGKNSANPRTVQVPKGLDPGFDHIPGASRDKSPTQFFFDKAKGLPPLLSSTSVSSLLSNPQARGMLNREVAAMVDKLVRDGVSRGASLSVGAIAPGIIKALDQRGLTPSTSVITLRDQDVLHALRPGKHQPLPVQFWRDLADHLMTPERVLLMKNENPPVLLYVYDLGGDKGKIALKMDYDLAVKTPQGKRKVKGNIVRTGSMLLTQAEINSLKGEIAIWQK